MKEYPTAKELMESNKWLHRKSFKAGLYQLNYYVEQLDSGNYTVYRISGFNLKGAVIARIVLGAILLTKLLLNIVGKGLGQEVLGDLIEEITEALLARRHLLTKENSFNVSDYPRPSSIAECDDLINKDIEWIRRMNK
jgi:hypothetical protein